MDILRRHLFLIVCGAVGAIGVALMITGARAMPDVLGEMQKVESIYRTLNNLQSRPVSRAMIVAQKRRIDLMKQDRDKLFAKAKELYAYEQLVPGALPDGDSDKRIDFRSKYAEEMDKLLSSLNYGGPAMAADIKTWRERIEEENAARKEYGLDPGVSLPPPMPIGPAYTPAGVLTASGARQDAEARAHMAAAQRIYCYASHFKNVRLQGKGSSLDFWAGMQDTETLDAPEPWDVWHAQLGYWIQKDVVEAIAAVNNEGAEEAGKKGKVAWVGMLPVKELISIRLSDGLVPREGDEVFGTQPGGYEAALPPGTPETVFTHSGANESYDVVQFTVKLIADQRRIPGLIDRLCKNSFHTLLRVSYEAVPPNRRMVGKIYGAQPTVNVLLDFETILLGEVFRRLVPPSVIEFYEIQCREADECLES